MSYLEGKRIRLTRVTGETTSGLVLAQTFDQGALNDRDESFDVLLHVEDGLVDHKALVTGTKLEFLDDATTPAQTYPWTDAPPGDEHGTYVRVAVWYDAHGDRRFVDSISIFDRHADPELLKDRMPEAALSVVRALRGLQSEHTPPKDEDTSEIDEFAAAYEALQGLLEGQALGVLVPDALNRLFDAIRAVRSGTGKSGGDKDEKSRGSGHV